MYKGIIVEDELLVQIGIKSLINWEENEIEMVGLAVNGHSAYELIKKEKINIVITDIKMPVMDGMELLRKCRETLKWPIQFILLTSYEEFQLAREAIQLGVVAYLVKMDLSADIMLEALENAKKNLVKEDAKVNTVQQANEHAMFETLFKQAANHLLAGGEIQKRVKEIDEGMMENLCLLHFDIGMKNTDNMTKAEEERVCRCVEDSVHEILNGEFLSYEIPIHSNQFFSLLCLKIYRKEDVVRIKINELVKRIILLNSEYFNVSLKIGCSSFGNEVRKLAAMYDEASQSLRYTRSENDVFFFYDIRKKIEKKKFDIMIFTGEIMAAYEQGDAEGVRNVFLEITALFQEMLVESEQMKDCCHRLLYFTLTSIDGGEEIIDASVPKSISGFNYINKMIDHKELIRWIFKLSENFTNHMTAKGSDYSKRLVNKAQRYVQEHITDKILLTRVADELCVNASYLSGIFKKHAKVGFSDYVNQKKIEYASTVLVEDKYKIYEVAEMLGYENAYYFSKVFKRYMHVTPKEYISNRIE